MRQKTYCLYPVVEDTLAGSLLRQRQLVRQMTIDYASAGSRTWLDQHSIPHEISSALEGPAAGEVDIKAAHTPRDDCRRRAIASEPLHASLRSVGLEHLDATDRAGYDTIRMRQTFDAASPIHLGTRAAFSCGRNQS